MLEIRETIVIMHAPVAVLYADLNLRVDDWQSGASWVNLQSGLREDVVPGAPVVVTDGDDAFLATVTELTAAGPHFAIHWDRRMVPPHVEHRSAFA